jgi:hypothetical protein
MELGEVHSVSNFSPGPWKVAKQPYDLMIRDSGGRIVATAYGWDEQGLPGHEESRAQANAHLIAACPDMYEALKVALEDLEDWVDASHQYQDNSGNWVSREYCECHTCNVTLPLIRRVLAKAEGKVD